MTKKFNITKESHKYSEWLLQESKRNWAEDFGHNLSHSALLLKNLAYRNEQIELENERLRHRNKFLTNELKEKGKVWTK